MLWIIDYNGSKTIWIRHLDWEVSCLDIVKTTNASLLQWLAPKTQHFTGRVAHQAVIEDTWGVGHLRILKLFIPRFFEGNIR